jgi:hypothetical protein
LVTLARRLALQSSLICLDAASLGAFGPRRLLLSPYDFLNLPLGASGLCVLRLSTIWRKNCLVPAESDLAAGLADGVETEGACRFVLVEGGVKAVFDVLIISF